MSGLTDRVAVVTGASGGIGAGLATMLASEGARVALAARRKEQLDRAASFIRDAGGVAVPVVTDVTNDESLANLVERTRAELGPIDILVNNAGYAVWKPHRSNVTTRKDRFSSGTTGVQLQWSPHEPWTSTSGSPSPAMS